MLAVKSLSPFPTPEYLFKKVGRLYVYEIDSDKYLVLKPTKNNVKKIDKHSLYGYYLINNKYYRSMGTNKAGMITFTASKLKRIKFLKYKKHYRQLSIFDL